MLSVLTKTIAAEQCSFYFVSAKSDLLLKSLVDTLQNISKASRTTTLSTIEISQFTVTDSEIWQKKKSQDYFMQ